MAVTQFVVTPEICKRYNPHTVGRPKGETFIADENGEFLPEGGKGEFIIGCDTVSPGNLNVANNVFPVSQVNGKVYRSYRTGDNGYIKDGYLFYCGRIDSQVKLHGYRIEIEDIENNFLKLPMIRNATVVTIEKDGIVNSLTAFVLVDFEIESNLKVSIKIKKELQEFLLSYMIPKKFVFKNALPMASRGKIDRRKPREKL